MRISRENTMIENYLYPLAGMTDEEIIDYFTDYFSSLSDVIYQIEAALLLHNIPLYAIIVFGMFTLLYLLRVVADSSFPTPLFAFALIPLFQLFRSVGGFSIFRPMKINIPDLPPDAPNRIRDLKEIIEIIYKPLTFSWRLAFFIYRTYVRPNLIDTIALLLLIAIIGLICMVVDFTVLIGIPLAVVLFAPAILTRKAVYDTIMLHLGHPLPELNGKEKTD